MSGMISLDVLTRSMHHMGEQGRFSEGAPASIAMAFCTTKGRGSNRANQRGKYGQLVGAFDDEKGRLSPSQDR